MLASLTIGTDAKYLTIHLTAVKVIAKVHSDIGNLKTLVVKLMQTQTAK
jgi:hypothetical protein